jgi:hypothetical protein
MLPMLRPIAFLLAVVSLFLGMLALLAVGRRMGARHAKSEEEAPAGVGLLDGAVFGLMGFLVALTYSGAESRFQARRELIVEEANAISSAYELVDLMPEGAQPQVRETFRRYVDSRIAAFQWLPDIDAAQKELDRSQALQKEIWNQSIVAVRDQPSPTSAMLLTAMNRMSDIATTRTWAAQTHVMLLTLGLLFVMALTSSLLAGMSIGRKMTSWLHLIAFAAVICATIYVIIDLEYPRAGIIHIYDFDQALIDVRNAM